MERLLHCHRPEYSHLWILRPGTLMLSYSRIAQTDVASIVQVCLLIAEGAASILRLTWVYSGYALCASDGSIRPTVCLPSPSSITSHGQPSQVTNAVSRSLLLARALRMIHQEVRKPM